jgi:hypothetical protein
MSKLKDKIKVSIILSVETYEELVNDATKEKRSVSSQGALIIQNHYENKNTPPEP